MLNILIFLITGLIAGFFGEFAGGAPTIVLPILLLLKIPIKTAVASMAFAVSGLQLTSSIIEYKRKKLNLKLGIFLSVFAVLGSVLGANLLLKMNEDIANIIIKVFISIAIFLLIVKWRLVVKERKIELTKLRYFIGAVSSFGMGIYGSFFGAGIGILNTYLFMVIFGKSFFSGHGLRKMLLFFIFLTSTIIFILNKAVDFSISVPLIIAMVFGAIIGSRFMEKLEKRFA